MVAACPKFISTVLDQQCPNTPFACDIILFTESQNYLG